MKIFFVKIHDFLIRHRAMALVVLVLLVVTQVLVGLRIGYKEDVADFLPQDEEAQRYMSVYENLGGEGTVTAIFESDADDPVEGHYAIVEAVEIFESLCDSLAKAEGENLHLRCHVDESLALDAISYTRDNIALFLSDGDYRRIDSLLSIEGYVDSSLVGVSRMMAFPLGSVAMSAISSDPLNLFSPVLQRLSLLGPSDIFEIDEGILFDTAGRGYAFVDSPYGGSDTKGNSRVDNILSSAVEATLQQIEGVRITCVGAPIIAVGNAKQIKGDSLTAMAISVLLIAAILFVALRRKRNILLLAISVIAGWLFALAAVALLSTTVSIIVIGIGSVLVGIAVNYPLHFLEHFEHHPDRRETLKEMVEPLVTGNITTVSAFACLLLMDSDAMRDLGLFGALMLIGTILFVMLFLPLMLKEGGKKMPADEARNEEAGPRRRSLALGRWSLPLFAVVVGLTVWLGIRSVNPTFDSDLHNINYMTDEQRNGLSLLNGLMGDSTSQVEYVVSTGKTLDEALHMQEAFWRRCAMSDTSSSAINIDDCRLSGVSGVIPSLSSQSRSLRQWNALVSRHPALLDEVRRKSSRYGFTDSAFSAFFKAFEADYSVVDPSQMHPLTSLASNYISPQIHQSDNPKIQKSDNPTIRQSENPVSLVTMLSVPLRQSASYKSRLHDIASGIGSTDENTTFVFDMDDLGNNLVRSLNLDFNYILYLCGFVVFFFLWLSFGRLELALLSFLPLAVAWMWILGIMDIASVKFNIVNIILATFIFGQGDDYTIFITEGLIYENAYGERRLRSYRRSVIVSALLMFAGIGSLIVAKHPAMKSLAQVAIIGMAVVVAMACYLPPLVFRWLVGKEGTRRDVPLTLKRLVRTVYVLIVFVLFVFLVFTPYTFVYRLIGRDSEAKRMRFHAMIQRFIGIGIRHIPGVGFRYDNRTGETFGRPAVIVANHQSHLDLLCVLQMSPRLVILTNDWVWRNPIYGAIIRYAEFYPVHDGFDALVPKLRSLVDRGYSIVVFPEGTRSPDGEIGRFHKGAFQLAQQLGVDLLPVMIHGASHVMPKRDLVLREGLLTVEVKPRVEISTFAEEDSRLLANKMRQLMKVYLEEMRTEIEDEDYWESFVLSQYLYKGREVWRRAARNMREYKKSGKYGAGQGEVLLLKALSHRDETYSGEFDDLEDFNVAKTIVNRLGVSNLTITIHQ